MPPSRRSTTSPGPADSGSAAEGPVPAIQVKAADKSAKTAEAPLSAWPSRADSAKAADRAAAPGRPGTTRPGPAEGWKPFRFALADSAVMLEVLHEMGIWTYIPVNLQLLGTFWRITGTDERGNEVTVLEGERLSGAVLALAERISWSRVTVRVTSADHCRAAESSGEPVSVTVWVVPAVTVTVSAGPVPG